MAVRFPNLRAWWIARKAAYWRTEMLEPTSSELRAKFDAWLATDPDHVKAYEELGPVVALSSRLPPPVRRQRPQPLSRNLLRPAFVVAIAAVALVGVLLVTGREPTAAYAAVTNFGPAIRMVRLSDGSTIALDTGTDLSIALKLNSREVQLRTGRARFRVTTAPTRPFVVSTADGKVTANGGEFDVAFGQDQMTVVPLKGSVAVNPAGKKASGFAPLSTGDAARIRNGMITSVSLSRENRLWPAGRLSFDQTPLATIVNMANRLGGPPIRVADDSVGAMEVTAILDLRDTHALARKLAAALDLKVIEHPDGILLKRK